MTAACARADDDAGASAIVLHEDKKYYPTAEETYGPGTETLVQDEDAQPLEVRRRAARVRACALGLMHSLRHAGAHRRPRETAQAGGGGADGAAHALQQRVSGHAAGHARTSAQRGGRGAPAPRQNAGAQRVAACAHARTRARALVPLPPLSCHRSSWTCLWSRRTRCGTSNAATRSQCGSRTRAWMSRCATCRRPGAPRLASNPRASLPATGARHLPEDGAHEPGHRGRQRQVLPAQPAGHAGYARGGRTLTCATRRCSASWGSTHCSSSRAGHINFSDEMCAALRLADGVLLVVDAVEGVMMGTERAIRAAAAEGLPICLLLSKMDRLVVSERHAVAGRTCAAQRARAQSAAAERRSSSSCRPPTPITNCGTRSRRLTRWWLLTMARTRHTGCVWSRGGMWQLDCTGGQTPVRDRARSWTPSRATWHLLRRSMAGASRSSPLPNSTPRYVPLCGRGSRVPLLVNSHWLCPRCTKCPWTPGSLRAASGATPIFTPTRVASSAARRRAARSAPLCSLCWSRCTRFTARWAGRGVRGCVGGGRGGHAAAKAASAARAGTPLRLECCRVLLRSWARTSAACAP